MYKYYNLQLKLTLISNKLFNILARIASVVYPEQLWVISDCPPPPPITRVAKKFTDKCYFLMSRSHPPGFSGNKTQFLHTLLTCYI